MSDLDLKIKKEKVKQLASNSILFKISSDELETFKKGIDNLPNKEGSMEVLSDMESTFLEEFDEIKDHLVDLKPLAKNLKNIIE
jgi:hypothetical protein